MEFSWLITHWFDALQTLGIIGGLFFTGFSLLIDAKVRRVANLLTITEHHREIWLHLSGKPELRRVLEKEVDLTALPITEDEELFVMIVILHLNAAEHALRARMFDEPEGLPADIREFFSLPIPKAVWNRAKHLQNRSLVDFVEKAKD